MYVCIYIRERVRERERERERERARTGFYCINQEAGTCIHFFDVLISVCIHTRLNKQPIDSCKSFQPFLCYSIITNLFTCLCIFIFPNEACNSWFELFTNPDTTVFCPFVVVLICMIISNLFACLGIFIFHSETCKSRYDLFTNHNIMGLLSIYSLWSVTRTNHLDVLCECLKNV